MQFDHDGGLLGGAGDVHTTHYISRYVHSRGEVWAKAPEGFSAQSAVGASKLRSQTERACDACSRAHPHRRRRLQWRMEEALDARAYRVWLGAVGRSNCVRLDTRDTWRAPSVHAQRDARRWCAKRVMQERCPLSWAERACEGRCVLTRGASTRERGPASLRVGAEWRPWG